MSCTHLGGIGGVRHSRWGSARGTIRAFFRLVALFFDFFLFYPRMGMSFSRTSTYVAFYRMAYSSRGLKVRPFIPKGCLVLTGVPHPPSFSFGPPLHCHSTSWTSAMSAPFPRCSAPRRSRSPLGPLARRSHPAGMSSARPDPSQGPGALLPPPGARPCDMSRGQAASAWVRASRALRSLGVRRPTPGVANGFFFRH